LDDIQKLWLVKSAAFFYSQYSLLVLTAIENMAKEAETPETCPVDPATRAAWLKSNASKPTFPGATVEASSASKGNSCDSSTIDQATPPKSQGFFSRWMRSSSSSLKPEVPKTLGLEREVSTIPRASPVEIAGAKPANSERESGVSATGNWIYPSEKMFFEAMKRKGHAGEAADMKTIVPIHNAVNERAWKEIKEWERPWGSEEKYEVDPSVLI
jgi:cytochrome c heme-lyase